MVRIKLKQTEAVSSRFSMDKLKSVSHKCVVYVCVLMALVLLTLQAGCSTVSPWTRSRHQSEQARLSAPYDQIMVKQSIIQNAVPKIQRLNDEAHTDLASTEIISHSENVVVALGQSEDGFQTWFNMVTFSENELNVVRKYFFVVDDKTKSIQFEPSQGLRFDCEVELDKEVFADPDVSDNARRIAILQNALNYLGKDVTELRDDPDMPDQGNRMIEVCWYLINQTFDMILRQLERSPILASRLNLPGGVEFDHINFDKGKIQLALNRDVAVVKIRVGAFAHMIETPKEVKPIIKEQVSKPGSEFRR